MTTARHDRNQRFFFMHIQKTAGTALRRRLVNHFGELAVYPTPGVDGADAVELYLSTDLLRERMPARGDQIRVIAGHFPLAAAELIEGPLVKFTMLRHPVDRVLSGLRRKNEERAGPERRDDLVGIYEELHGRAGNHMTKLLSLSIPELSGSMVSRIELDRGHLDSAKEALSSMEAVGLQERFEDFCDLLTARFGWKLGEPRQVNVTAPVEAPESLRERIAEDNSLDIELYEFATRMLDANDRRDAAITRAG